MLLAALCAALFWLERPAFAALIALVVAAGGYEWGRLAGLGGLRLGLYAAGCTILYAIAVAGTVHAPVLWAALPFWIIAVPWWLATGVTAKRRGALLAAGVAALVPAGLAMSMFSAKYLLLVLGLVWTSDIAAYVTGSTLGKHKLQKLIKIA